VINIFVQKNEARVVSYERLTSGTANTFSVQFTFSSDWDCLHKTAVFTNGITTIDVLENMWRSDNICHIPHEILAEPNRLVRVGVRGTLLNELQLSTPMCSIGNVLRGADAFGDKTTDPTLPVWEQLREDFCANFGCTTSLEKRKAPGSGATSLRVYLGNIASLPANAELHLYRCVRNRHRRTYWQHPTNYNYTKEDGNPKWGYGLIANKNVAHTGEQTYPEVPYWMPNAGYMNTEMQITSADRTNGYIDLDLSTYLLPLLKPVSEDQSWTECGFVGLQGAGTNNSLLLRFRICKNGIPIDEPGDVLRLGVRGNYTPSEEQPFLIEGKINCKALYTSIK